MSKPRQHDGLLFLCAEVILDGLDKASLDLVEYTKRELAIEKARKQKKKIPQHLPVVGDLYWVMSDSDDPFTFVWYCNLFNLNTQVIRDKLIKSVNKHIKENVPLYVFRKKAASNM
jgi:hypothetical protein